LLCTEGQQQLPTQRVATNVLADDKKVQAKVSKKLAKQQVGVSTGLYISCMYVCEYVAVLCGMRKKVWVRNNNSLTMQ